jgi:hypothetical protein
MTRQEFDEYKDAIPYDAMGDFSVLLDEDKIEKEEVQKESE